MLGSAQDNDKAERVTFSVTQVPDRHVCVTVSQIAAGRNGGRRRILFKMSVERPQRRMSSQTRQAPRIVVTQLAYGL